jgi:hypothetical protein
VTRWPYGYSRPRPVKLLLTSYESPTLDRFGESTPRRVVQPMSFRPVQLFGFSIRNISSGVLISSMELFTLKKEFDADGLFSWYVLQTISRATLGTAPGLLDS